MAWQHLTAARAELKAARQQADELAIREVDLQGQLAKAHSSSLHDKTHINKLVLAAEERQLAAEQDSHRQRDEVSRLQAVSWVDLVVLSGDLAGQGR